MNFKKVKKKSPLPKNEKPIKMHQNKIKTHQPKTLLIRGGDKLPSAN